MSKTLLVVDYSTNWYEVFGSNLKLANGNKVVVEQVEWKDLTVEMSAEDGAVVHCRASENPLPFSNQGKERIVKPDFMLVRNFPIDLRSEDYKNQLMGLMMADVPSVNSLHSIFMCMNRPLLYGELLKIQKKLEKTGNPSTLKLIPLRYCTNATQSSLGKSKLSEPKVVKEGEYHSGSLPSVVKVSNTHAGYGKMQIASKEQLDDLRCILALHKDYFTIEPTIKFEYEFRIQKIGNNYRCFRRNSSSSWKGNWGNVEFTEHEFQDQYKVWADECAAIYGGLDILALDVLHVNDDLDIIIELNDTACGLMWEHEAEDVKHIKNIVVEKMNNLFQ